MKLPRFFLPCLIVLFDLPGASSYIDPGTSGLVLRSAGTYIIGFFGIILGFVTARFIGPIKRWIRSALSWKK